jgi:hypothetical protein
MQVECIRNCREHLVSNIYGKRRTQDREDSGNSGCDNKDLSLILFVTLYLHSRDNQKGTLTHCKNWNRQLIYKTRVNDRAFNGERTVGYSLVNVRSLPL